jgi:hypothetical protein
MNELQSSQVRLNKANADKVWFDMGVANEGLIARERSNDGSFETMEDDDVEMAKELGEARSEKEMEDILNPPAPPMASGKPGAEGGSGGSQVEGDVEPAKPAGKENE